MKLFGKKSKGIEVLGHKNQAAFGQTVKQLGVDIVSNKETSFKAKDVAILRECLANVCKRTPPGLQQKIIDSLKLFALSIKEYCMCEDKVYIEKENRFACLNCGTRHRNKNGDPKIVK